MRNYNQLITDLDNLNRSGVWNAESLSSFDNVLNVVTLPNLTKIYTQKHTGIISLTKFTQFTEPNFIRSEWKVGLKQILFENDPLDEPKKISSRKKFYLFRKIVKKQNVDQNRTYPSLRLQNFSLSLRV